MSNETIEPKVCEVGGSALLLPLGGDWEHEWPKELRAVLYLAGLLWCFCGVAIVADVFMASIEKITSKKVTILDKKTNKERTYLVWNPTVANLTLMALGSSAPEILLNVIGIFSAEFYAGELGPSTIVGSAAFNLLCIIAVCVVAIPNGEVRKIKDMGVFAVTGTFSIFAYIWLLFILMGTSPDVVEAWEGILTFVFFWVLVFIAFLADTGRLPGCQKKEALGVVHEEMTPQEMADLELKVRQKYGKKRELSDEEMSDLIEFECAQGPSRAAHRVEATRSMFGGKKVMKDKSNPKLSRGAELAEQILSAEAKSGADIDGALNNQTTIEFAGYYTCRESDDEIKIEVLCNGPPLQDSVKIKYSTENGTAVAEKDFDAVSKTLEFGPGKTKLSFPVTVKKSNGVQETRHFFLKLKSDDGGQGTSSNWSFGKLQTTKVTIIDQDHPGILSFDREKVEIPSQGKDHTEDIVIQRKNGSSGEVRCRLMTDDDSAVAGADFEALDEEIVFPPNQDTVHVKLNIKANTKYEAEEKFRIILKDASGGATFDKTTDGGEEQCFMTVVLTVCDVKKSKIDILHKHFTVNRDVIELGNADYKEQFISAFWVGGSRKGAKESTWSDVAMHILSVPWKLLFATVPPTAYCGGWLCFSVALLMIGFVTCLIGDLAELLGCVLNIGPGETAITLVAVGTSLPDTFASKTAAQGDPYADASIGNVTGSNSVNVFLGLGLPWMIAAVYWQFAAGVKVGDKWSLTYPEQALKYPEGIFVVPAGALGTSVSIFTACAVTCIACLLVRRKVYGGELGGPKVSAYISASFFVSLWVLYLVLSIVLSD